MFFSTLTLLPKNLLKLNNFIRMEKLTLTNRSTNTIKYVLLLLFMCLTTSVVSSDPPPMPLPYPINKKLPGQPPIKMPLERPTIINITNVINES